MIKVSAGTAHVLGLKQLTSQAHPTTAYLMAGENCSKSCAFCTQARSSSAGKDKLSRIVWPLYPVDTVIDNIKRCHDDGLLHRACLQLVEEADALSRTTRLLRQFDGGEVPVCISGGITHARQAVELVNMGADRIGIPLDAACERVYRQAKGGNWAKQLNLLIETAKLLPGKVSTHLIVGLGETEEEMLATINALLNKDISIGLFAFTPVRGTAYATKAPPPLPSYRRIQAAHYLLKHNYTDNTNFRWENGRLIDFGLAKGKLLALLGTGEAFRTSGCPDCNRPYYNEKPGGVMYNYPRPLTAREAKDALMQLEV